MVKRKAINTCEDGTCRTLVAWYAKGGRSNFAAWNGTNRFLMTAVLEEYDEPNLVERFVVDNQVYNEQDDKCGFHAVKESDEDVCGTLSTFCELNKLVVEVYNKNE